MREGKLKKNSSRISSLLFATTLIDDDAILYSFQNFFIRKIFYLILRKLDDHLKKQRNKKKNSILKKKYKELENQKEKKNQKIIKTKEEKFVKKSNHNHLSFIFENESRFYSFRQTKKNKWTNSFNKSITYKAWQFRKNIFKFEENLWFSFLFTNWTVSNVLSFANRIRSSSKRNTALKSQSDDEIREIETQYRRNDRAYRSRNQRSKEHSNFDEYSLSLTRIVKTIINH